MCLQLFYYDLSCLILYVHDESYMCIQVMQLCIYNINIFIVSYRVTGVIVITL